MSLRILGGLYKSRLLKAPKSQATRPTTSIVRKAVFDICSNFIEQARVLDLFAGSGLMGFEALSRGAKHVTFVDNQREAIRCIRENARLLQVEKNTFIVQGDALPSLKRFHESNEQFDLAYVDPPYNLTLRLHKTLVSACEAILKFIDEHPLIVPGGRIFFEEAFPGTIKPNKLAFEHFFHCDSRKFGTTLLHQFQRHQ